MAVTIDALLKLVQNEKEVAAKAQLAQAGKQIAAWQEELSNIFTKDVWAALGLDPGDATIDDEDKFALVGRVFVQIWSIPVKFRVGFASILVELASSTFELISNSSHHHNNTMKFMRYLAEELAAMPDRREYKVREWRMYLGRATTPREVVNLRQEIDAIPGLTPELDAQLSLECDEAAGAINTVRCHALHVGGQVAGLAKKYLEERAVYQEACERWAKEETAKLWKPWMLWKVKYAPARNGGEPLPNEAVQEEMTDTHPTKARQALCMRAIFKDGAGVDSFYFGAFFSAHPVTFDAPQTNVPLNYHRVYRGGSRYVNVPALDPREPSPLLATDPGGFTEYVRTRLSTVSTITIGPELLAEMNAEDCLSFVVLATDHLNGVEATDEI